jgi:hypothetical protein
MSSSSSSSEMAEGEAAAKALRDHYWSRAAEGVVPSAHELRVWARKRGHAVGLRQIRQLRHLWKATARHSRWVKPPVYMGASIDKLGNIFVDMAHFMPHLRVFNKQCKYFLVAVDSFSQKLACLASANATQATWEKGVIACKEHHFPVVSCIVSDRDTAVAGETFQRAMRERYGIRWIHLRSRSKAFHAERMIRYCKERLSQAMQASAERGDANKNNWIRHVGPMVDDYNSRFISGTTFRRRDASPANYLAILEQKYGFVNPTTVFNSSVSGNFSSRMGAMLFKYPVGARVLLSREADYTGKQRGAFAKKSVTGSYGNAYRVSRRLLKSNGKFFLSPVYGLEGLEGLFYESELTPALFSEADLERQSRHELQGRKARSEDARFQRRRPAPPSAADDRHESVQGSHPSRTGAGQFYHPAPRDDDDDDDA